jgi:hypothetical protein
LSLAEAEAEAEEEEEVPEDYYVTNYFLRALPVKMNGYLV